MDRRQFIGGLGLGLISLGIAGCGSKIQGNSSQTPTHKTKRAVLATADRNKLVVSTGTEPNSLIEKGLIAMGGIGQWVKSGSSVVIKPNFSVPRKPNEAATTDPHLVAAVVEQCLKAGAREVKVIDHPFAGPMCIYNSGIKEAVEAVGGQVYVINNKSFYKEVDIGGKILKNALYSKDALEADVLISIPKLKHHSTTKVTMGLKNMMGLVWDRGYFHSTDLNQTIAELAMFAKPDLNILDATRGIIDNGPMGPGTIHQWDQVIFGIDALAVDAYGANLFGHSPNEIGHLSAAAKLGLGQLDITKLKIEKV